MKENYYVLNSCGYESYQPIWFKSTKSKTAFKKIVKECIHKGVKAILKEKYYGYISGYDLLEKVVPIIEENGFEKITPHLELSVEGECLYSQGRCNRRPTIIPKEDWKLIIAHNERIDEKLLEDADESN